MPIVQAKKLTKVYQNGEERLTALDAVDIEIERGEFLALTGASGSGKTTFMHLMGCLDLPTSGELLLEGEMVSSFAPKQLALIRNQKIGFVFQHFHLLNDLTALENVLLPQLYGGISEIIGRKVATELLELVGLGARANHYPNQLSGGQKQRVAIARALAMEPCLLFADEPTGNLDSENAQSILDLFCHINASKQTTIIIVTHDHEISQKAHRRITMRDGRIARDVRK